MFDDFVKIHSFKLPNCNKDSQAAASSDKKSLKNLPGIKFSNANQARWLVAVLRRDSIFGKKKLLEIHFLAKKVRWKFARRQTEEVVGPHKSYSPETILSRT